MMFNTEVIENMAADLQNADTKIRKTLKIPDDMENPAEVVSKLTGLSRAAASAAQALALLMSNERDRELLSARLRSETA